jgi:hypothetical protein
MVSRPSTAGAIGYGTRQNPENRPSHGRQPRGVVYCGLSPNLDDRIWDMPKLRKTPRHHFPRPSQGGLEPPQNLEPPPKSRGALGARLGRFRTGQQAMHSHLLSLFRCWLRIPAGSPPALTHCAFARVGLDPASCRGAVMLHQDACPRGSSSVAISNPHPPLLSGLPLFRYHAARAHHQMRRAAMHAPLSAQSPDLPLTWEEDAMRSSSSLACPPVLSPFTPPRIRLPGLFPLSPPKSRADRLASAIESPPSISR